MKKGGVVRLISRLYAVFVLDRKCIVTTETWSAGSLVIYCIITGGSLHGRLSWLQIG